MKDLFGQEMHEQPDIEGEDFAGAIVAENRAAVLFHDGESERWYGKSQIRIERLNRMVKTPSGRMAEAAILTIPDWIVRENEKS